MKKYRMMLENLRGLEDHLSYKLTQNICLETSSDEDSCTCNGKARNLNNTIEENSPIDTNKSAH